jgi:hypothetical protein
VVPVLVEVKLDRPTRRWMTTVGGQPALRAADLATSRSAVVREAVSFQTDEEQRFLTVGPSTNLLQVSVAGFPDWTVTIPSGDQCAFRVNESQRLIDLMTPKDNTTNLVIRFPDGGRARMWSASYARYDVMDDTSYYFSGQGYVEAEEADGVQKLLSPRGYPMVGGPLIESVDDRNRRRWRRIIPPVALSLSGELRQRLGIATESGTVTLSENQTTVLELENGALVALTHDASNGWLRWHVQKGYVHFHIPEIRCWRGMGLTDQQGEIQWSGDAHAVDLHNATSREVHPPARIVIAALSHSMTGSVGPGSVLQYLQLEECTAFSAASQGEEVHLTNTRTGESQQVRRSNVLVQHSRPGGGVFGSADTTVIVGETTVVRGTGASTSVSNGETRTLVSQNGREMTVSQGPDGTIRLTAVFGDHTIKTAALGDWTFTVREGDTLVFPPGGRRDILVVFTGERNNNTVDVFSPDGFAPRMPPDTGMTFVMGDSTSTVEAGDRRLVFFEQGGVGTEVPFGMAEVPPPSMDGRGTPQPFGRLTDAFDPNIWTRLAQPPASVVR